MRIAIDARMGHTRVGIGVYVRGLLSYLREIDKVNEYFVIVHRGEDDDFVPKDETFTKWHTSISYGNHLTRDFWEQICLPWMLRRHGIDVYHGPNYVLPIMAKSAMVLTIYDMISFADQDWNRSISRMRVQRLLTISAKRAHRIITGSKHSEQDVIRILRVPEKKVRTIYLGVDGTYRPITDKYRLDAARTRYGIKKRFVLYVGTLHMRKNVGRLIEAYGRLPVDILEQYQLVIAGRSGRSSDELIDKVRKLGLQGKNVVFTGFVEDDDLPLLMNAADLLVFPSLYEGFGIPPLEAMACGTPVIASNTSSIPEVVGEAALLFDPYEPGDICAAMYKALTDDELRDDLKRKGFERVRQFSWERTARETLAVYEEACDAAKK